MIKRLKLILTVSIFKLKELLYQLCLGETEGEGRDGRERNCLEVDAELHVEYCSVDCSIGGQVGIVLSGIEGQDVVTGDYI